MSRIKNSLMLCATTLLAQCAVITGGTTQVQAQNPNSQQNILEGSSVNFQPPQGEPAPKTVIGGGRRGNDLCEHSGAKSSLIAKKKTIDKTLVPLLPSSKLGFTASSHPTFMVHVPPTSSKAVEFTVYNQEGEGIYQTQVNIAKAPGIISFALPKTEPALAINQDYKFVASIICQQSGPKNPFTEGLVRRISPDSALRNQLDKPKSLAKVILYSQSGYWFDAMENLAALKLSQPDNVEVATAWDDLLTSVGLEGIAKAPLQN